MRQLIFLVALVPVGLAAACSNNPLGSAVLPNVVDTVVLGALVGTPIVVPSAFSVNAGQPVRTDQTSQFDFAYNIDPAGRHVFLTPTVLGLPSSSAPPGLLATTDAFSSIDQAPLNGYVTADTIPISVGERYIIRGQVVCTTLGVPQYGKLQVLSFDDADRKVTFEVLSNRNCGFRNLQPGTPTD
jgi:hypothetical protein